MPPAHHPIRAGPMRQWRKTDQPIAKDSSPQHAHTLSRRTPPARKNRHSSHAGYGRDADPRLSQNPLVALGIAFGWSCPEVAERVSVWSSHQRRCTNRRRRSATSKRNIWVLRQSQAGVPPVCCAARQMRTSVPLRYMLPSNIHKTASAPADRIASCQGPTYGLRPPRKTSATRRKAELHNCHAI